MKLPNPLTIDELIFIVLLSSPIILWGFRNGLDAVIIAVIGVMGGMLFADTLATGVTAAINVIWQMSKGLLGSGLDGLTKFKEVPALIQGPDQLRLVGTVIFAAIAYVAFKIAAKRAGGRSNIFEGVFGAVGGAVTGYIIVTFLIPRHLTLPQRLEVTETQLPQISLDANVLVLIMLVIIVFGVQGAKKKK